MSPPIFNISTANKDWCLRQCTERPVLCNGGVNFRPAELRCEMFVEPPASLQVLPGCEYFKKMKSNPPARPRDCADLQILGNSTDGVHTVYVGTGQQPLQVYCDMTTDGGGWLVFQRRKDGSENFYRGWAEYAAGFGSLTGEFWLGNDNLHALTASRRRDLRVDMGDFEGETRYAEYDHFQVNSAADKYRLVSVGAYTGTAGDSLNTDPSHIGMQFSTPDQDNDGASADNCAIAHKGAWWYNTCHDSNLNGYYFPSGPHTGPDDFGDGVNWNHWKGYQYSLKFTEMKIRPHEIFA